MKTHVRTNLSWSKLLLITAVIAFIAMISAVGLCFTNANADDSSEPANAAEINIPVSILNPRLAEKNAGSFATTEWTEIPDPKFPKLTPFKGHTYTIVDKNKWVDDSACKAIWVPKDGLTITLATKVSDKILYKSWKINIRVPEQCIIVSNNEIIKLKENTPYPLKTTEQYNFCFGDNPQMFNVDSKTKDATNIFCEGNDFDKQSIKMEGQLPQAILLNSIAVAGTAYYDPKTPYTLTLKFSDKSQVEGVYNIEAKGKIEEGGDYYWTYNGKQISTDPKAPTKIAPSTMTKVPFLFNKKENPKPIDEFKVKGQVIDESNSNPVPNATVGFFNSNVDIDLDEPLVTTHTDENGNFVLEGCYTGEKNPTDLKLTYMAKHYANINVKAKLNYEDIKDGVLELKNPLVLKPCMVDLYCDGLEHQYFTITTIIQYSGEEPTIQYNKNFEYIGLNFGAANSNDEESMVLEVKDGGVLYTANTSETDKGPRTETLEIVPHSVDGYSFVNYLVNNERTYKVGDSIDLFELIESGDKANIYINYSPIAGIENVAQTGDNGAFVISVLAIISIAATAVFVALRKKKSI